jgi:endo-1,4-beta-mannosidase
MEGCRPFFVTGINVDNLVEASMADVSAAAESQGPERIPGREMVRNLLHTAAKKGLNVVRTWAHTTDPSHPIQDSPGEYVPDALEALDYVISQAEAVGVRVQLSFVDMWRYRGGIGEFVDWSRTAPKRDVRYPPLIVEGDVTPEVS